MKRRGEHRRARGGYALMAVLGLMALLVVYIATIWSAVGMTIHGSKRYAAHQMEAQGAAAAIEMALAAGPTSGTQTLELAEPLKGRATVDPLDAAHPVWSAMPGLGWRAGDRLVSIVWEGDGAPRQYIANPARQSILAVPAGAAPEPAAGAAPEPAAGAAPEPAAAPGPGPGVEPAEAADAAPDRATTITTPTTTR